MVESIDIMLTLEIVTFDIIHITTPAGKATTTARFKTNNILPKIELIIILNTSGLRYAGNSKTNDELSPFKMVIDKIFDTNKVIIIPSKIKDVSIRALIKGEKIELPTKKALDSDIKIGNLPLQGTKQFVKIAINLSLFESIILAPVTPTALHPNPIHIVNACFPQALHLLKHLSKLNAILGKYPKSSRNVNNGKKIAIGGNITAIIHVTTLYIPSYKSDITFAFKLINSKKLKK